MTVGPPTSAVAMTVAGRLRGDERLHWWCHHPLPSSLLIYNERLGGYEVNITKDQLLKYGTHLEPTASKSVSG